MPIYGDYGDMCFYKWGWWICPPPSGLNNTCFSGEKKLQGKTEVWNKTTKIFIVGDSYAIQQHAPLFTCL